MRGSLKQRSKGSWSIILYRGREKDAATGKVKQKQKWITFHGTRKQAETKLTDLLGKVDTGMFIEPSKVLLAEWLTEWLTKTVKPTKRRGTFNTYQSVINSLNKSKLGAIKLQALKPIDVQQYYADHATLSAATVGLHAAVLRASLKSAVKNGLVQRNVASLAEGKPRIERTADDIKANVLDVDEARRLLASAKAAGTRTAAFYALALDSGARLGELCGVKWSDVDLDKGTLTIVRQLISAKLTKDGQPDFGPTKTGRSRTVDLGAETVTLLRKHRQHQKELKFKNQKSYSDLGLAFTKEHADLFGEHVTLGTPMQMKNIGNGEFATLRKAAAIKRITFHGLRHTSATLLLQAGEPVKVVSERLGHSKVSMTLDVYAHVLPSMGRGAAEKLSQLLHG